MGPVGSALQIMKTDIFSNGMARDSVGKGDPVVIGNP